MYSNTVYLQYSNLKDYQWVRCTHNTLAQGSSKDCTTFGLERFRALSLGMEAVVAWDLVSLDSLLSARKVYASIKNIPMYPP